MKVKILNIVGDKTFKGLSTSYKKHPKYKKYITSYKTNLVHFEEKSFEIGDEVLISETKPISKRKRWILKSRG